MSIVRVGLAETRKFAEGYDAIFGKKKDAEAQEAEASPPAKAKASKATARKKKAKKK